MYVCMYVCIHIYIYIYTYTHTHTHTPRAGARRPGGRTSSTSCSSAGSRPSRPISGSGRSCPRADIGAHAGLRRFFMNELFFVIVGCLYIYIYIYIHLFIYLFIHSFIYVVVRVCGTLGASRAWGLRASGSLRDLRVSRAHAKMLRTYVNK